MLWEDSVHCSMNPSSIRVRKKEIIPTAGGEGTTEDDVLGWHHRLDGHESEQAPGVGDGQGGLECCSPWSHKESDTTERLN